jgi:patatin-related protein
MIEHSEQPDVTGHLVLTPEEREAKLAAVRAIHAQHIPAKSSQVPNNQLQDNQIEREIRFAVVIYGGVSLTIYINGIVQEMLHLVRSTAIDPGEFSPVELVYRELATKVGEPAAPPRQVDSPKPLGDRPGKAGLVAEHKQSSAVRSRFIVDILSGTSAGGINAIFLAKALANNLSIDSLAKLWITQADLNLLLNDKKVNPGYLFQDPPPSLLNAPWMYLQLLKALNEMNLPDDAPILQPLVEDLDLFCTTTDLRGLPVGIALTDESVQELRYRNFYHFKRRTGDRKELDHFTSDMDPFLAFAARCTSSFPVAFEPMQLGDIASVIGRGNFSEYLSPEPPDQETLALFGPQVSQLKGAGKFREICQIYETAACSEINFWERPFGDGGYLDNKPFTYAIETMKTRHADLPVDRKLIYIEPSPEDLGVEQMQPKGNLSRPNAIENSLDALVVLPRYETIRQDLESVIQWNANISRLHRVLDHINRTITERSDLTLEALQSSLGYSTYHRLRLSGTSDQLGNRLAATVNVDSASAQGQAIRSIAGTWREVQYDSPEKEQEFLDLFDFTYCGRALRFLRLQLQQLPTKNEEQTERKRKYLDELAKISALFLALANTRFDLDVNAATRSPVAFDCWTQYLNFIVDPRAAARAMGVEFPYPDGHAAKPPGAPPVESPAFFSATDAGRDDRVRWLFDNSTFTGILNLPPDSEGNRPTPVTFGTIVESIAQSILKLYRQKLTPAEGRKPEVEQGDGEPAIQYFLRAMDKLFAALEYLETPIPNGFERFIFQDVQIYPIIFGTTLGEFETVDIFRISPQETRPIEGTAPSGATGSPTLRGQSLDAFGAFLDQEWRLSDMLRGRLDGAERIITAILPDSDADTMRVREQFIQKAQEAIATEWQNFQDGLNLKTSPDKKRIIRTMLDKLQLPKQAGSQRGN